MTYKGQISIFKLRVLQNDFQRTLDVRPESFCVS